MSIASEVTALQTNLTAAKDAVVAKGGTVEDTGLAGLADEIASIPAGGGGDVESVTITNKSAFENLTLPSTNDGYYITVPLAVTVAPNDAPQMTQVVVSDSKIANVIDNGDGTHSVRFIKGGTVKITVRDYSGSISDSVTATIMSPTNDVAFRFTSKYVTVGGTVQLAPTFAPATATDQTLVWSSDNDDIVVDQTGLVTCNAGGHATISAYSAALDKTITCTVESVTIVDAVDWLDTQEKIAAGQMPFAVGTKLPDKIFYDSSNTYDVNWIVLGYPTVTKADGTTATGMAVMLDGLMPFSYPFSRLVKTRATEETAQPGVYYYGYNGSTYTALNLETGETIPYGDYTSVYKSGINYTDMSQFSTPYHNRWDTSQLRAGLNSDADNVSASYVPQYIEDSALSWTRKGFLQMINPDLLSVVTEVQNTTKAGVCFGSEAYITNDKFWLPSKAQLYAVDISGGVEGEPFQYFVDFIGVASPTDSSTEYREKKAINTNSVQWYWTRSASLPNSYYEYGVGSSGNIISNVAFNNSCVAPACVIC